MEWTISQPGWRAILMGEGGSMSNRRGKSPFALVGSVVGVVLMTQVVAAQTVEPAPGANSPVTAAAPVAKSQKKGTPSVIVVVTNSRAVALTSLGVTPLGGIPKAVVADLAPGNKIPVLITTAKSCVFDLHAAYADGASADLKSINLCKDKNVNLVE
jgi:hypothetical protein